MTEAQGDFNRPWLRGSLGTDYLPSIPDLHARLSSEPGARVADVACGVGWAGIALARSYPSITVDGFDLDELSIDLARANAQEVGVGDRVTFHAGDAAAAGHQGEYDLAIVVESIHDMAQPVDVMASIRDMLRPGGSLSLPTSRSRISSPRLPARSSGCFRYADLLPAVRHGGPHRGRHRHGHARSTFEDYAAAAGFAEVEVLPIGHDFLRFYRLDRRG